MVSNLTLTCQVSWEVIAILLLHDNIFMLLDFVRLLLLFFLLLYTD
jgi:hypothetical protein